MAFFKTLTQGGQTHLHQLRMLNQILYAGLIVAFISGGGYFAWKSFEIPSHMWRIAYEVYWARFMLISTPDTKHKALTQLYTPYKGKPYLRNCLNITKDPFLKKTTDKLEKHVIQTAYKSGEFAGYSFLVVMILWFVYGVSQKRSHHKRGNRLVSWKELRRVLRRTRKASDIRIGKLPLVKDKETSHTLITGTTGSGKTNSFHILIPQLRKRKDKAIILDVTGDYVSRYYDEATDLILNPLDKRSVEWNPWADCTLDFHYDVLAESLIQPKEGSKDPFWDNASRTVLKTALRKFAFQGDYDTAQLCKFLVSSSDKEFEEFFKNTEATTFSSKNNEKTTHSIRSVLASQIEGFNQLSNTTNPFSIRDWVMNESKQGWLFITARPDQRQTLTPLISAWVDIAINALMILSESQKRRLWFIIDELAALQKLPRLQTGLAEARKYGGCFLIGFQSKPQLEDIYGKNACDAMLDLFNTKLFFRCTEPSTQTWISKVLGDKEEAEPTENISFGANSLRDGVSLGRHTHQKPLVMPTELALLKDLECYIKFPGNYSCTKLQTSHQEISLELNVSFQIKEERKRDYGIIPKNENNIKEIFT